MAVRKNQNKKPKKTPIVKGPTGYDEFKEFEGKKYVGMKVGRGHKWHYDKGEWKEKKITPDKWQFTYDVKKRRSGKVPEGSGVPVGTEYHWYILAHQTVQKLTANDYSTTMTGQKIKIAHKRFDKESWNISDKQKRKRLISVLQEVIDELKRELAEDEKKETVKAPARKKKVPAEKKDRTLKEEQARRKKKAKIKVPAKDIEEELAEAIE